MTCGFISSVGDVDNLNMNNDAFQEGRTWGNGIAATQAMVEMTVGAATFVGGVAAAGATGGGAVVAAIPSAGGSIVIGGIAISAEAALAGAGALSAAHGGAVISYIKSQQGFLNQDRLSNHFGKHGSEFGFTTVEEYENAAQNFVKTKGNDGVLSKVRQSDGATIIYNPSTNEFSVVAKDGVIQTYFKPDPEIHGYDTNLDYYNAQ